MASSLFSVVDPSWELIDPNPDIHELFNGFNQTFFWGKLSSVYVQWSPKMTLCAGLCKFHPRNRECSIHLSKPLLSLRPRKDLVETLLHEMIHAFLFIADGNRERESHGPKFHEHMYRINKMTGAKISVYHTFHDEVKHFKTHWWKCDGPCQHRHPFYGLVKRSMNRAPGPNDFWYKDHQKNCGGTFVKIKEPPPKPKKEAVKRKKETTTSSQGSQNKKPKDGEKSQKTKNEGNENKNKITNYFDSPSRPSTSSAVMGNKPVGASQSQPEIVTLFDSPSPKSSTSTQATGNKFAGASEVSGNRIGGISEISGNKLGGASGFAGMKLGGASEVTGNKLGGASEVTGNKLGGASGSEGIKLGGASKFTTSMFGGTPTPEVTGNKLGGASQHIRRGDHPLLAKWRLNNKPL